MALWLKTENGLVPVSEGGGSDGYTYMQDSAPEGASNGQTWFDTLSGDSFVWYDDGDSQQWVQSAPGGGSGGGVATAPGWVDYSAFTPTMQDGYTLVTWRCWFNGQMLSVLFVYNDVNGVTNNDTGDITNVTIATIHPTILALAGPQILDANTSAALSSGSTGRLASHSFTGTGNIRRNAISSVGDIPAGTNISAHGTFLWNEQPVGEVGGAIIGGLGPIERVYMDDGTVVLADTETYFPPTISFVPSADRLYRLTYQIRGTRGNTVSGIAQDLDYIQVQATSDGVPSSSLGFHYYLVGPRYGSMHGQWLFTLNAEAGSLTEIGLRFEGKCSADQPSVWLYANAGSYWVLEDIGAAV